MQTQHDWLFALADAAQDLLRQAGIEAPPVDALALARSLQLTVVLDRTQPGRGRIKRVAGQAAIFLRPEEQPERLQWAVAHELGESLLWKVCRSLDVAGAELSPHQREELANQFAKELLLPFNWFRRDCAVGESDLAALKTRYRTASHELIAWRWLDLEVPGIVTVFDQGTLTRRRGNGPASVPALMDAERRCWEQLMRTRQPATIRDHQFTVRGWCIDTASWQREILYVVAEE